MKLNILIGIVVLILGISFYWYSFRPSQIKKDCYQSGIKALVDSNGDVIIEKYDVYYKMCLERKGL